ncbi:LysR family transcriptional regulator [uncultured Sneathiella sp.]|uniref:LysR family transcriptional regulator n=1 Tax=uncultured Sneathiella sp. TaxID=879315 RepID=UPI002596C334|nr:LysR family transcriptional regulator [uncultured Sneathiella sp.]
MSWDHYRYFLAVAETGSLSAAARQLSVSQPTVGRQIAELEKRLGTRLFERASHGYLLTLAGQQIRDKIKAIESDLDGVEQVISGLDNSLSGTIRISATEGFGSYWLTPKLGLFQRRHPNIRFELMLDISVVDLRRREADIALRLANPRVSDLIGRQVGQTGFGLYGAQAYLDKHGQPKSVSDLANHDFIGWKSGQDRLPFSNALEKYATPEMIKFRCDTVAAQIAAVRSGMGLFLAPHYLVPREGEVVRLLPSEIQLNFDIWLLTHRDLVNVGRVRALLDFLYEQFRNDRDFLLGEDLRP